MVMDAPTTTAPLHSFLNALIYIHGIHNSQLRYGGLVYTTLWSSSSGNEDTPKNIILKATATKSLTSTTHTSHH